MDMRTYIFIISLLIGFTSCTKTETATKTDHYRNITYRIETQDSNLQVNFPRAAYEEVVKGNIKKDSVIVSPGIYMIPATVLANEKIELFGMSYISGNFSLQIIGPGNVVLAQAENIPLDPANQLHPDRWFITISATP